MLKVTLAASLGLFLFMNLPLEAWQADCACVKLDGAWHGKVSVPCEWYGKIKVSNHEIGKMCNEKYSSCHGECTSRSVLGMNPCSLCIK